MKKKKKRKKKKKKNKNKNKNKDRRFWRERKERVLRRSGMGKEIPHLQKKEMKEYCQRREGESIAVVDDDHVYSASLDE